MTPEHFDECKKLNAMWYEGHEKSENANAEMRVQADQRSLELAFELFHEFNFKGGILRVDGKAVAFNMGCPLTAECFIGMFAKADNSYQNASIFMIHQFIKNACPEYPYFNFTEDGESPGLRKFKMDMQPEFLTPWYSVKIKGSKV